MRLSLLELQILVALDERKTLTQIGEELFVKHPSISRALHAAEQKTGVVITEHIGRRLRLTSAGEVLAARARDVLAECDDLDRAVEDLRDGEAGAVHVLATRTACTYILPRVLQRFVVMFSRANVSLQVATPDEVWQRFVEEHHDIAVGPRAHDTPSDATWLFDDQDRLYVRSDDPVLRVPRDAPFHLPTLIAPMAQETERHVDEHLRRHQVTFGRRLDIRSLEAAKQLVEAGIGAGLFGRSTVARELAAGHFVELSWLDVELVTSWCVAQRSGRRPSPLVNRLVALLEAENNCWRQPNLYAAGTDSV